MTDAELVLRARGGDELAFRRLLDRHVDLIRFHVSRFFDSCGLERSDFEQEARYGFYKAVQGYRTDRGSGFRNFASLCIERQVISAMKRANLQKRAALNHARSLSEPIAGETGDIALGDLLADQAPGPDRQLVEREELAAVAVAMWGLTDIERVATLGIAEGRPYEEIAESFGASAKGIDNASQRGKRKLAKALAA